MHLSEEEIHQYGKGPEEQVVDPVHHGDQLLLSSHLGVPLALLDCWCFPFLNVELVLTEGNGIVCPRRIVCSISVRKLLSKSLMQRCSRLYINANNL